MKHVSLIFVVVAAALLNLACATTGIALFTFEDENIYAELETNDPQQVNLIIDNRSSGELSLDQSSAAYTHANQESRLIAVDGTQAGSVVPALQVAPQTRQSRNFALERAVTRDGGVASIGDWVPPDTTADRFAFVYRLGDGVYPINFPDTQQRAILGRVTVTLEIAMPAPIPVNERRRRIYEKALEQANASFGAGGRKLKLVNLRYSSTGNFFKESAVLSADVIAAD
ncbi:MAG: hypothetical protein LBT39_06855 [Treponema sp.]|jgi:hypothetical protein|nr:hypothetical protein [Treponema sp.]